MSDVPSHAAEMARALASLALLAAVSTACAPEQTIDLPPTEVVYEGDQVRLHAVADLTVCGGNGAAMDAMLAYLADESGLGLLETPIDAYLLTPEQVDDVCYVGYAQVFACAFTQDVEPFAVTSYLPTEHELVHAYLGSKSDGGRRWAFFDEGLATVYGRDGPRTRPTTPLDEAIGYASRMPVEHYTRAAHFVAFMIDRFGPQATIGFVLATSRARTDAELAALFLEHFGVSLQSTMAAYEREAQACSIDGWQRIYECEQPALEWPEFGSLRVDIGHACDAPSVLGEAGQTTNERFVIDLAESSTTLTIHLETSARERFPWLRIVRCGSCEEEVAVEYDTADGPLYAYGYPPGKYVITAYHPPGDPEPAVLKLTSY